MKTNFMISTKDRCMKNTQVLPTLRTGTQKLPSDSLKERAQLHNMLSSTS